MANEWYVQHGGKQYGPMTSANLKKLATEGKISPNTTVRLGSEGNWVPAARVQGLFAAGQSAAAPRAAQFPNATPPPAPKAVDLAAPPIVPPQSLPMARPLAPTQLANVSSLRKAVPAESGSVAPKVLGAVAIILGAVALATCWLPSMSQGPVGWTGIVVGGLGLVIGIVGLIVAAMQKGVGLMLNLAGTSGAAVGLVLAVVLNVVFGFFTPVPIAPPVVIAKAPAPVVVPPPKKETPPPIESEPEPVWVDAKDAIEQGNIKARIVSVAVANVVLENMDLSVMKKQKPQPKLKVKVAMENTSTDKILEFGGWHGGADMIGQGVGALLGGELGKAAQAAAATALLTDNIGNKYKQVPTMSIAGAPIALGGTNASLRPGKTVEAELIYDPPLDSIEYLRLELSPAAFAGSDALRFQIPKEMVTGLVPQP